MKTGVKKSISIILSLLFVIGMIQIPAITASAASYTVYLNANGGSSPVSQLPVETGTGNCNNLAGWGIPSRAGAAFLGWYDYVGNQVYYADGWAVPGTHYWDSSRIWIYYGDVSLIAYWSLYTYTVYYNANGGSGAPASVNYNVESTGTLANPTRENYTFNGWKPSSNSGNWSAATSYPATTSLYGRYGTVTLVAQWSANPYTLILDVDGGAIASDNITYTVESSETLPLPTRMGYDFAGWKVTTAAGSWAAGAEFADGVSLSGKYGDATLTAQWTAHTDTPYTVNHYYMDATGSYDVEPVSEGKTGTTDTSAVFADLISVPAHFTYDAETTGATSANIDGTGDAVINLYYARDQYAVSFVSGATGETLDTQTVYYEADATEPEAPEYVEKDAAGHFKFTGWDEDFTNITGDLTVTALYEEEGHDFGAFAFADEDNHERTCANCDYVETESHNYLFDSFLWSADNTSAQAKLICEHCGDEKLVAAEMSEDAHAAACEQDAYTIYTATYGDESDSKTVTAEGTALEHNYLFDSFVWSADNTSAQAKLICERCGDEKLVAAEMSEDAHAAECEKDAYTVYTATYGGETDSKTVTAEGTALEHNYLFDSFVWSADNTTAQAKVICEHCGDEKLVDAAMSEDVHAAECEKDAYTVYTATYGDESDSKTVTAEGTALEHNYLFNSFVWSADNTSAQAKVICERCGDEKLVAAEMSEDAHAAECEKDAYTVYTATYGDESDSKTVTTEGTALEHNYLFDSFVWSADNTSAQAKLICEHCDDEKLVDVAMNEDAHAAECEKDAYTVYTATYGDETDSKTVTAEGTALAHSFIYTSNGDGTHAVTCANCDYSASADCEYDETSHAATCVEGAYITYTCKDCGYTYDGEKGEPDPSNHVGAIHTVGAVAATADEDGYTGDKVCSACGETVETGTVIPAGSETPDEPDTPDAPDTPDDGETEDFHCAYCGKIHPKTFTGWIIYIFHMLAAIIRSLTPVAAGAARL